MNLVAFVGKDKEGLGQISALINHFECERIFIVKDKNTPELIKNRKCKFVSFDMQKDIISLKNEIKEKLQKELSADFEVALSLPSGSGKEHMALISALLAIPIGIKLVVYTKKGIEFLS